jgi:uncharacterized protein
MRFLARIALLVCICVLGRPVRAVAQIPATAGAVSSVDSTKLQLIRAVLAESHAVDLMYQSMQAAAPAQRAANPAIPAAFFDRFLAAVRERKDELVALFIPIYERHFTADELRQLLAFYRTPIGQKLIAEQPAVAQEAMAVGQQWGQRLGFEIGQKMAAEAQKAP